MIEEIEVKEFKSITKRTRELLNKEEGLDVDFKRNRDGVKSDDIVAFANSPLGGTILVGIDEYSDTNGRQKGKVVGCKISDGEKLAIISKATSCRPPVDIILTVENNVTDKPFYRIDIPSGAFKPYCTERGLYTIRGDGRTNPLTPDRLLSIYLEEQGKEFIQRFKHATRELDDKLAQTKKEMVSLTSGVEEMKEKFKDDMDFILHNVDELSDKIEYELKQIFEVSENANSLSDESMNFSMEAVGEIQELSRIIENIETDMTHTYNNVVTIRDYFNIEDPYITRARETIKELTKGSLRTSKKLSKSKEFDIKKFKEDNIQIFRESYQWLNPELVRQWVEEALQEK